MKDFNEPDTRRNILSTLRPERKPVLTTRQRKRSLLENRDDIFKIVSDPDADGQKPWYAIDSFSEVKTNEKIYRRA